MHSTEDDAETAETAGDLALASRLWRELAERERDPVYFTRYGRVAQKLERWDEAESAFTQALSLDPNFAIAMDFMGHLWASRTDKSDAESFGVAKDWFLRALRYGRNARTLTFLGATYRALGDLGAARALFEEAIELNPEYEEGLYNLALAEEKNNPERAIDLLERAIEIDPDYFEAHQELGKLQHAAGDLQVAEYHFRRSLEVDPAEFWSLLYLANVLAVQGKTEEAEHNYRLAVSLHPDERDAAEFFASFLESIGKTEEADSVRRAANP